MYLVALRVELQVIVIVCNLYLSEAHDASRVTTRKGKRSCK